MASHPLSHGLRSHPSRVSRGEENGALRKHPRLLFDPRNTRTPLAVWVRADLSTTMNGSTVSGWADMSGEGNNFAQATASSQPSLTSGGLGGRAELSFDGSADVLTGSSLFGMLNDDADWTTVVVCRGWTWGGSTGHNTGRSVIGAPSGGGGYFNQSILAEGSGGPGGGFYNGSAHATATAASAGDQGASIIWSMINDGGDLTIRVNGDSGTTVSGAGRLQSASTTLGIGHGTGSGASTAFWDGDISEALIFDGTLSGDEIKQVEQYLGDRYNIRLNG